MGGGDTGRRATRATVPVAVDPPRRLFVDGDYFTPPPPQVIPSGLAPWSLAPCPSTPVQLSCSSPSTAARARQQDNAQLSTSPVPSSPAASSSPVRRATQGPSCRVFTSGDAGAGSRQGTPCLLLSCSRCLRFSLPDVPQGSNTTTTWPTGSVPQVSYSNLMI